jgi:gas vesicle structural protein
MAGTIPIARATGRRPSQGSLAEVVDIILDKGLVLDAYVRVSLVGIELLTVDARVVIASVDTYLHFAEAVNRLDIRAEAEEYSQDLQELIREMREGSSRDVTKGVVEGASDAMGSEPGMGPIESSKEKIKSVFQRDEEESDEDEESGEEDED